MSRLPTTLETQIIGEIAQNAGGAAAGTGGLVTRQSNKSDSGGGAIYGCRSRAGTEACVAANNLRQVPRAGLGGGVPGSLVGDFVADA